MRPCADRVCVPAPVCVCVCVCDTWASVLTDVMTGYLACVACQFAWTRLVYVIYSHVSACVCVFVRVCMYLLCVCACICVCVPVCVSLTKHDPHMPWSLTPESAPVPRQSTSLGRGLLALPAPNTPSLSALLLPRYT